MNLIKRLIAISVATIFAFLIAEVFLRFTWDNPYKNASSSKIVELRMQSPSTHRIFDRSWLDKKIKKVSFRVDKNRFIQPSNQHSEPEKTIMFLGGSTTENSYVQESLRFPNYVSALFYEQGRKVNTINLGRSGSTLHDSINVFLNEAHKHKPDIVVIMHAVNDGGMLERYPMYQPRMAQKVNLSRIVKWLAQDTSKIYFVGLIRVALTNFLAKKHEQTDVLPHVLDENLNANINYEAFEQRLEIMVHIARSFNAKPILMTQPLSSQKNDLSPSWANMNRQSRLNQTIRLIGQENDVPIIDLSAYMRSIEGYADNLEDYFYDGVHVTDKGSIEYGKHIHNRLSEMF